MKGAAVIALGMVALVMFLASEGDARPPPPHPPPPPPPPPRPKPSLFQWVPVRKGGIVLPELGAEWHEDPNYPGQVPQFYDSDTQTWVLGNVNISDPNALVVNREELP